MGGVVDLREMIRGWAGSSISSDGYLGTEPYTEQLDLSDWYRFHRPGHYSLTIKCHDIGYTEKCHDIGYRYNPEDGESYGRSP